MDEGRRSSILSRRTPDEVVAWTRELVERAEGPTYLPGDPQTRRDARLVVPLRCQDLLLGYLSVIDADGTIDERATDTYASAGSVAATILYRERLLHEAEQAHAHRLVRDVLFGDREARGRAAERLVAEGLLSHGPVAAIVIRWRTATAPGSDDIVVSVRRALARVRRTLPPGSVVEFTRTDQAVLLVHLAAVSGVREFARDVTTLIQEDLAGAVDGVAAGFGDEAATAADAGASYDQAVRALEVGARLGWSSDPIGWCDLGVNRMLSRLTTRDDVLAEIPPGCRELARHPELLRTVERYLELGCEIKNTATELSLHRTSLYARLEKAQRITGLSFKRGEDRLALHLSLRLIRLTGGGPAA